MREEWGQGMRKREKEENEREALEEKDSKTREQQAKRERTDEGIDVSDLYVSSPCT